MRAAEADRDRLLAENANVRRERAVAALDRHTNPTLNENDLRIEPWGHGTPDMSGVQKNPRGVRITHIPSGHVAEWDGEKSQLRNREIALGALRSMLALDRHTKEPDDPQIFGPPRSFPKATT
jgi:protein subunit release factor A